MPYVPVRDHLKARVLRSPFQELVVWAQTRDGERGGGVWFELGVG